MTSRQYPATIITPGIIIIARQSFLFLNPSTLVEEDVLLPEEEHLEAWNLFFIVT